MSDRASGGAVKRKREQQVEEEDAPASMQAATVAHTEPLMLLALVKANFDTLVWLQLCNPQGVALFPFVCIQPRVRRPFAGAPVYDMSLTHGERLRVVGCGLKGKLVRLLSLSADRHFEPQRNMRACRNMMQFSVRRVAAGMAAAVRDRVAKEAAELCASGQCAAALVPLQQAIDLGHLPSRALKAWLLIDGRAGVAQDEKSAFELAEEGMLLGCHHCQGVLATCYFGKDGCGVGCVKDEERSVELARQSSGKGSRYGQFTLGMLNDCGEGGLAQHVAEAAALYRLAAAQGLDEAQCMLGNMYYDGEFNEPYKNIFCGNFCVTEEDEAEGLRLYQLAAAQGHPEALYKVADFYKQGRGVAEDVAEAIRWYKRAQAAGHPNAEEEWHNLLSDEDDDDDGDGDDDDT